MDATFSTPPHVMLEVRRTLTLALPIILAQLAQVSMGFIDTLMVGRLGGEALAGVALGASIFFFALIVGIGVMGSVAPTVSQAVGANDPETAARATRQSFYIALALTLPATLLFWQAEPLLNLMGQEPRAAELAAAWLRAISWGYLPSLCLAGLRGFLEGLARPRPVMLIAFLGVGLNVIANYTLIFGHFGFPAFGVVGTGWASAFVYWMMFLTAALYVRLTLPRFRVLDKPHRPDPRTLRDLLVIGLPIGLMLGFESGLFSVTALLMGTFGTVPLAAHQIAIQTASFTFMIPLGLAAATAVRVGQAVGRADVTGTRRAGWTGIVLSAGFMSLTALAFWLLPEQITSLYLGIDDPADAAVGRTAAQFLAFAAAFQVVDGLQVSAAGALRGLKDTRVPMLISLVSYWGVGLSTGLLFAFGLNLGGRGLWLGLVLGLSTAAVLLVGRFWRLHRLDR
ncbi:MAG: Multi antimicrobial extrusion protein (Na(+)/drug antiporter), MATE family of MDR efflux pumps [uncultured Truepera sp.]|uniref:Multidrug-efflux transporter n=1 Tax=uncultured Truepera sp. TaxID=543023 RepID=A0A6J4VTA0_9DEIN|nr:MAG: Multi antimicrobial extrusion protein (Na(+)/drug antiporter), MATE family of MDR efflux pumps [uncultured Truepera sp.]